MRTELRRETLWLQPIERNPECAGRIGESAVIAREPYGLSVTAQKINRRDVKRIQRSDRFRKRFQSPGEYCR